MDIKWAQSFLLDLCGRQLHRRNEDCRLRYPSLIQGEKQKQIINEIFYFKQPLTLEYEANKLVEEANKKQSWAEEEDRILFEIVQ